MKNKFVLTEEESKRILTLHKKKIQEERDDIVEQEQDIDEQQYNDPGQATGRVAAGAATGAATGAGIGAIFGGIGAVPGAVIGTALGALGGWLTTGGGYSDRVFQILKWCSTNAKKMGKPVNTDEYITDIADNIRSAVEGFGRTDEVGIARSLRKLKSIPDLCRLNQIYARRNDERLFEALSGDFDINSEWGDYIWRPISELVTNTSKISKKSYLDNAKKCGFQTVEEWKKSGWKCSKKPVKGGGSEDNGDGNNGGGNNGGGNTGGGRSRGVRYGFDYQEALKALNTKKCVAGGGGGAEDDKFADDWRAVEDAKQNVDTTVSKENIQSWAS
jgi:uncharacterized membrane protein YgcG